MIGQLSRLFGPGSAELDRRGNEEVSWPWEDTLPNLPPLHANLEVYIGLTLVFCLHLVFFIWRTKPEPDHAKQDRRRRY